MTDEQPQLSGAAAFRERSKRQEEGEVVELSSGLVVKLRRPNEAKLIQNGEVPAQLAMSSVNATLGKASPADLKNYVTLQRLYARLALVDPLAVDGQPSNDGEISIDDLNSLELNDIYFYVTGGMDGLNRFREGRQRLLARLDSQTLPGDETERPVRPEEPGQS